MTQPPRSWITAGLPPGAYDGLTRGLPASRLWSLLLEVADVLATSLDLDTTLRRVSEVVRKVIDYEIFAILLLNERTHELRMRFQIGYPREIAERMRVKVGEGVTGRAAQLREPVLVNEELVAER